MLIGFDFDGTLVDCSVKQIYCLDEGARCINISLDLDKIWNLKRNGMSNRDALRAEGIDAESIEKISKFWISNIETPKFLRHDRMFMKTYDLLENLTDEHDLFLVSARRDPKALFDQIRELKINKLFNSMHVATGVDVAQSKAAIMKVLRLGSYIGDTEIDYRACMESQVDPHIVCTGQRSRDYLKSAGIEIIHDSLSSVIEAGIYD